MAAIARMIDANTNRAREAMRILEDAARFALDDTDLSRELKSLRHALRAALDRLPPGWIEANRDTPGDVGTTSTTPAEQTRASLADVTIAAGKRLSEALRSIEEVGKTIDTDFAGRIESIRYRGYELERRLHVRLASGRAQQWRLCVLLTMSLCRRPWRDVLDACVDHGADCVQVREKAMLDAALLEHVRAIVARARSAGVTVIVNDRIDIALAAGADGVHLGEDDLPIEAARRIVGRQLLIGASTHDLDEATRAVGAGADYCGVGAMFSSSLKPGRAPTGAAYLQQFIDRFPHVPHLAIGGITPSNVHALVDAGARGVAVSNAICRADDPASAVRALRHAMDEPALDAPARDAVTG